MNILIIEDDLDTQANLRDILELDGHRVEAEATLQEALERGVWSEIAVILLDRRLPDGTADDLLPRIRQLAPGAAVIIITGYADLDGAIRSLCQGAVDFLPKPIDADVLRASLARAARLKEADGRALQAERLATIGQMVTVLAHESRSALQESMIYFRMLEHRLKANPEALELVARLEKAQCRIRRLFDDVQGYAAPITLERKHCHLAELLQRTWAALTSAHAGREAHLRQQFRVRDLHGEVDAFRMEQVFRNLLENALAACPDPVEISVTWSEVEVDGQFALRMRLRDNGPGLKPGQGQKVFEPFFTTKRQGTGLGLAITKRIVEAHGGQIEVGDTDRAGAEFVIDLPREAGAELMAPGSTTADGPVTIANG
jgi:signal transduction histidine kinase